MLTPAELGLPSKFTSWRQGQYSTVLKILASKKFAFLLDSPTGTGKSLLGASIQAISGQKAVYLTSTKQLQDQLLKDFPYARMLMGRNNYPCLMFMKEYPAVSAEQCVASTGKRQCKLQSSCPYMKAKMAAMAAPLAILNYSYFIAETNFSKAEEGSGFADRFVICDECDSIESHLMGFVQVEVTQRQIDRLKLNPPKFKTKAESWIEWAHIITPSVSHELRDIENLMAMSTAAAEKNTAWSTEDVALIKRHQEYSRLLSKLEFMKREVNMDSWVFLQAEDAWTFKPVWIAKYAHNNFWQYIDHCLCMSATILDPVQYAKNVGITSFDYLRLPSPFPKENRPIIYQPAADLTFKNMDAELPRLVVAIRAILEKHPSEKILIHTTSYKVKEYILGHMNSNRLISHNTKDRTQKLEEFKRSTRPLALVSPSMDRGIDLPDDLCRVVIVTKLPYPSLGDPQVKKRVYASKDGDAWYAHHTISTLIQMCGRGVRSETDWCTIYILDKQFGVLYEKRKAMFPDWFREAVVM